MKIKHIVFLILLFAAGNTYAQTWNNISGKNSFPDSVRYLKYRHSGNLDSTLTISPTTGNLMFVARSAGGGGYGVDSITITPQGMLCAWSAGLSTCYPLGAYYDSSALNLDSTFIYHYSRGVFVDSIYLPKSPIFGGTNLVIRDTTVTVNGNPVRGYIFDASGSGGGGSGGGASMQSAFDSSTALGASPTINAHGNELSVDSVGVFVVNSYADGGWNNLIGLNGNSAALQVGNGVYGGLVSTASDGDSIRTKIGVYYDNGAGFIDQHYVAVDHNKIVMDGGFSDGEEHKKTHVFIGTPDTVATPDYIWGARETINGQELILTPYPTGGGGDATALHNGGDVDSYGDISMGSKTIHSVRFLVNNADVGGFNTSGIFDITKTGTAISLLSGASIIWGNREVTLGENSLGAYEGVSIGYGNTATGAGSILMGKGNDDGGFTNSFVARHTDGSFTLTGGRTVTLLSNNTSGIGIGPGAVTSGDALSNEIAIGENASATGAGIESSIAIGRGASASGQWGIAIGAYSSAATREFVSGFKGKDITDVYFGSGKTASAYGVTQAGTDWTLHGSGAYGQDSVGGNLILAGGKSTGTWFSPDVIIQTSDAHSSDATLQTLSSKWWFKGIGTLANSATPASSAILDVNSTTKGAVLPRMTAVQRAAIASATVGLIVFDTDSSSYFQYTNSGWQNLHGTGGGGGTSVNQVVGERFTGSTSSTLTFAHSYVTAKIAIYKNGARLDQTTDFTEATANTVTLVVPRLSSDIFLIDYSY